jgi:hypothetical protein
MARQMVNFVYLIGDRATGEAVIVDPAYAVQDLLDIVEADGMKLTGVLATHYHPDHVGGQMAGGVVEGISALLEKVQVPIHLQRRRCRGWSAPPASAVAPGGPRQRRRGAGRLGRRGADPHARPHAGKPVLPGRRPAGRRGHALPRGLRPHRSSRLRSARHVRVHQQPAGPRSRRRRALSGPPLLGRPLAEHGGDAQVELRVPAPLRRGVDGHVRRR